MSTSNGADVESGLGPRTSPVSSTTTPRARPDPFLICCRCFRVVTALTAILCIVVNVFSAIQSFTDGSDVFDGIFRCYAVVIGVIVVVVETEWEFVMKFWKPCGHDKSFSWQFQYKKGSSSSRGHSELYAPCLWWDLYYFGNPMHWLSQTVSAEERNFKGASSKGS
ncbi:uncharacterized protein [Malus domestica]|uniref:uncharacterized protein isoform X2 n=1 Tax=Malus domestica TaxID=3750 RepID=UPI0039749363